MSVQSGRGQASHDRVMRFAPTFDTAHQALCFAAAQGQLQAERFLAR